MRGSPENEGVGEDGNPVEADGAAGADAAGDGPLEADEEGDGDATASGTMRRTSV